MSTWNGYETFDLRAQTIKDMNLAPKWNEISVHVRRTDSDKLNVRSSENDERIDDRSLVHRLNRNTTRKSIEPLERPRKR